MKIDGKGKATFSTDGPEGSIRFYLGVQNLNTEVTGFIKAHETLSSLVINHRAYHSNCEFGGYQNNFKFEDQRSEVRKEIVHADYVTPREYRVNFNPQLKYGNTYAFKSRCENTPDGRGVRLQTWIDYTGKGTNFTKLCDGVETTDKPWIDNSVWEESDAYLKCYKDGRKGLMATRTKDTRHLPVLTPQPRMWVRMNARKDTGDAVQDVVLWNVVVKEI